MFLFKTKKIILITGIVSLCACSGAWQYHKSGLAKGSPGMNAYIAAQPGESARIERLYENAPPMIPHSVSGLSISKTSNDCIGCHEEGVEISSGHSATRMPGSHFVKSGEKESVAGIRYNCLQCHLPQTEVKGD